MELDAIGKQLPTKVTTPLASGYRPELDQSCELNSERLNYFQGLIGVLRWICELGGLDIMMPVSMLSRYLVSSNSGSVSSTPLLMSHVSSNTQTHDIPDPNDLLLLIPNTLKALILAS